MLTTDPRDLYPAMTSPDDDRQRVERSYFRFLGVGIEFAVTIVALTVLGVWLDGRFNTSPLLTVVLLLFGLAAATWNLLRSVLGDRQPPHPPRKPGTRP